MGILLVLGISVTSSVYYKEEGVNRKSLGGPVSITEAALLSQDLAIGQLSADIQVKEQEKVVAGYFLINQTEALPEDSPLKPILTQKDNLMVYKIQKGDTIKIVAEKFGISEEIILFANNKSGKSRLKEGEEIAILPVLGVIYTVKDGETAESIAELYSVSVDDIRKFNKKIETGVDVIIPGAKSIKTLAKASNLLPNLPGYFSMPTKGWNWGKLHNYNAVDIANACGTLIYAAADGVVVEEKINDWNNGYGNYIVIEHPNGTKTLYAHNQKNEAKVGNLVDTKTIIAYMGKTGNVSGPTGCHLHFEVHGAKNPFVK